MKLLAALIGYVLLPLPALGVYLLTGSVYWSGMDVYFLSSLLGISAFIWLSTQLVLAAKPWGLAGLLGLPTLMRLHGLGALLSLAALGSHFFIKFGILGSEPSLQTFFGFLAMNLFTISVLVAVFFFGNHFPSPAKILAPLRTWLKDKWNWNYKGLRSFHNIGVIGVVLAGIHVLLAGTTRYSWVTVSFMALWLTLSLGIYLVYRIRGRS